MIKIIQLILFSSVIILFFLFFNRDFSKNKVVIEETAPININDQVENNQIKDLKYEISLANGRKYIIYSDLSKVNKNNEIEIIDMEGVKAIFLDEKNTALKISSEKAKFNNFNYYTNFFKNVKIQYLDNIIYSDKLNIDFANNEILILDNVKYIGKNSNFITDNIKIDLISNNIYSYMNSKNDKMIINATN